MAGDGKPTASGDDAATVAVIIDVVGSRERPDQRALLEGVAAMVDRVLVHDGSATSAGPSVGDEIQALYSRLGAAVRDLARLRLTLLVDPPDGRPVDVRAGIGVGTLIGAGTATAPGQSGSAWWRARAALEEATRHRNAWPTSRWWVIGAGGGAAAALLALDTLVDGFDEDDRRSALALLVGRTAAAIAADLGVVPSTLSARLHRHGVYGFVRTIEVLADAEAGA